MSWLGNIIGVNPNGGANFQASGVDQNQLTSANDQVSNGLNAQYGLIGQTARAGGLSKQNDVYNQMQGTAGQLGQLAQGQGPNPAQAALNSATGQNIANQASLMASARGANANTGLIAREAAQQGGALQQQAVGQSAQMQAQQQLGAINALQNQQSGLANLATTQAGQQIGAVGNYNQFAQGNQGQLLGMQSNINTVNSSLAQANQKAGAGLLGGILGGAGQASLARGGMVRRMAGGGGVNPVLVPGEAGGPRSFAGQYLSGQQPPIQQAAPPVQGSSGNPYSDIGKAAGFFGKEGVKSIFKGSGSTPAAPSTPGVSSLSPSQQIYVEQVAPGTFTQPIAAPGASDLSAGAGASDAAAGTAGAEGASTATAAESVAAAEGAEGGDAALAALAYKGGKVQRFAEGGDAGPQDKAGPISDVLGDIMSHLASGGEASGNPGPQDPNGPISDVLQDVMSHLAKGGRIMKIPAMVSPGEKYLKPEQAKKVAQGKASPMSGRTIPGKAKVKGDSLKNDIVPAKLEEGGVVIPRSVMQSKDPAKQAAKFVQAVLAKQSMKRRAA